MAKGLDKILKKISENPRQTLVGRYLSLIADIPDEDERAGYALDLAETIIQSKPNDALKIAYMIYGSGRHLVRSLRLVIACFESKGRAGKVAVLKLELEKLTKELKEESPEDSAQRVKPLPDMKAGVPLPSTSFSINELSGVGGSADQKHEDTRMAELDLGDFQDEVSVANPVDFLFPDKQPSGIFSMEDEQSGPNLNIAEGFFAGFSGRPGDTVLPVMPSRFDSHHLAEDKDSSGTMVSNIILPDRKDMPGKAPPGKTVNLEDMPRVTLDPSLKRQQSLEPILSDPLEWVTPARPDRLGKSSEKKVPAAKQPLPAPPSAPSEVFDRFFNSKKYAEAEAILDHTKMDRMFDWWRSRLRKLQMVQDPGYRFGLPDLVEFATQQDDFVSLQLDESRISKPMSQSTSNEKGQPSPTVLLGTSPSQRPAFENPGESADQPLRPYSGDLRKGVITEILAISNHALGSLQLSAKGGRVHGSISKSLLSTLQALPVGTDEEAARCFDLLQSLFGHDLGPSLVALLEQKQLCRRSPAWFGFYLDALLGSGYARKVIAESVLVAHSHATLSWIRVIWRRLQPAWDQLNIEGFNWSEDDGVRDFLAKISVRGRQRLATFTGRVHKCLPSRLGDNDQSS